MTDHPKDHDPSVSAASASPAAQIAPELLEARRIVAEFYSRNCAPSHAMSALRGNMDDSVAVICSLAAVRARSR